MPFDASKDSKESVPHMYKTLYIPMALAEEVDKVASANNSSFNRMVLRMIEYCLNDMKKPET